MGLFGTGAEDAGISSMTVGVDVNGMEAYAEDLHTEILKKTKEKIEDISAMESAINKGWQGKSRDIFFERFDDRINQVEEDLEAEYRDLVARLAELQTAYFEHDRSLMG